MFNNKCSVTHIKRRILKESIWKQVAKEDIWTEAGRSEQKRRNLHSCLYSLPNASRIIKSSRERINTHMIKGKGHPITGHEDLEGEMYSSTLSSTSALHGGGWSTPRLGRFTPGKEIRYPLYRGLGGPPGSVLTGAENLASTGIRSPDRPVSSQSLYRLRYPGPQHACGEQ